MRNKSVVKIANLAVLSALGIVLMLLGKYMPYPLAPWLELEPSDTVILIGYALYGFQGAITIAILKTIINILVFGPNGAIAVGQLTALFTSLMYCLGIFLTSKVFHLFKKGIKGRIASYAITCSIVAVALTIMNFLFFTPTFILGKPATFIDAWNYDFASVGINVKGGYAVVIAYLYLPFNFLKGLIVCAFYEIIFNRVIFHLLKTDKRFKEYFSGSIVTLKKKEKTNTDSESIDNNVVINSEESNKTQSNS